MILGPTQPVGQPEAVLDSQYQHAAGSEISGQSLEEAGWIVPGVFQDADAQHHVEWAVGGIDVIQ